MSKGNRKREAAALRRAEEECARQEKRRRHRRNAWIAAGVAVVTAAGVCAGVFAGLHHKKVTDPAYIQHHTIAASSDNYEVTQAMMTYFINSTALNFAEYYEDYLDTLGLDTTQPLADQTCYFDSSMSWLQYFAESAQDTVNWMLGFAEEARANGRTLSDEDQETIASMMNQITPADYGEHLTEEDIRACLELYYLAEQQETAVNDSLVFTDEEIEAYYEENKLDYLTADYAYYTVTFGENGDCESEEEALSLAQELAAASDTDFESRVKALLVKSGVYTEETVGEGYPAECESAGYAYTADDGFSDWLFADGRAAGDATVTTESGACTVYRVTRAPARDSSPTVDVRHILLSASTYGSDEEAQTKAQAVLDEWKNGAASEESFGELAATYSEDSNAASGGLYTGVTEGQMVETFNDWCFDTARQPGDTGIVQTSYGFHVMYFVGAREAWYSSARTALGNARYDAVYEGYLDTYHVTVNQEAVDAIEM